ncbi:unnamed protein product, partial [Closterium sp. NIES-65]
RQGSSVQIEYALNAVAAGATSLGIKATNGVVIATEKKLPTELIDETSVKKIQLLTDNSGVVYRRAFRRHSWCSPPRAVPHMPIAVPHMPIPVPHVPIPVPHMPIAVPHMPIPVPHVPIPVPHMPIAVPHMPIAVPHMPIAVPHMPIAEGIPVSQLVRETAAVMQEFTQSGGVRPFGVSLLMAGYDSQGPHLYQVDPSGSYFAWKASAIGKNMTNAKTFLEKRYTEDMELEDAIHTAILTLKEGFEGQIAGDNIEIGIVGSDKKFSLLRCFPSLSSLHMHSRKIHFTCSLMHRLPPPSISLHRTPPLSVRALLAINRAGPVASGTLSGSLPPYALTQLWRLTYLSLANSPQVQGKLHAVTLPPALAFLDLSYTAVSGALPNTLSTLTNLAYLELAYTSLSGQLPSTLSALSKLSHLWVPNIHLQGGQVGGSITTLTFVSHLTRLHTLELFGFDAMTDGHMTSLSGLSTLTRLQKLTYFRNVSCNFANPFPNTLLFTNRALFSHFPTGHRSQPLYTARDLSYNYFSDFPTWIVDLTRLQYIDVLHQYEQRWGYIPRDLDRLTGLRTLSVSAAPCQSVPHLVSQCRTLSVSAAPCQSVPHLVSQCRTLSVSAAPCQSVPHLVSQCRTLSVSAAPCQSVPHLVSQCRTLSVSAAPCQCPVLLKHLAVGNGLSGFLPETWSRLTALERLHLKSSSALSPCPPTTSHLTQFSLSDLQGNKLEGSIPGSYSVLKALTYLNLGNNQFSGPIPDFLGSLPNLMELMASRNLLSGALPSALQTSASLEQLHLEGNGIAGSLPDFSRWNTSLTALFLAGNNLTGHIPPSISTLTSLLILSLHNNQLDGPFPTSLLSITSLESLLLARNSIQGTLPDSLGQLSSLRHLWLSHNNLTGKLPSSFCNLSRLEILYLSSNSFYGPIPDCLFRAFPCLNRLDVSHNSFYGRINRNFEGIVPTAGALLNLAHNFFYGDPVLFASGCQFCPSEIAAESVVEPGDLSVQAGGNCVVQSEAGRAPLVVARQYERGQASLANNCFQPTAPLSCPATPYSNPNTPPNSSTSSSISSSSPSSSSTSPTFSQRTPAACRAFCSITDNGPCDGHGACVPPPQGGDSSQGSTANFSCQCDVGYSVFDSGNGSTCVILTTTTVPGPGGWVSSQQK